MSHPRPAYGRPDGGLRRTRPKQPTADKRKPRERRRKDPANARAGLSNIYLRCLQIALLNANTLWGETARATAQDVKRMLEQLPDAC